MVRRKKQPLTIKESKELFEKRRKEANENVFSFLKEVEGKKSFNFNKAFERIFGFKPKEDVFMQKHEGGILFYLQPSDYRKIYEEGYYSSEGAHLSNQKGIKKVKIRGMKGKVGIVRLQSKIEKETGDKRDLEITGQHEAAHAEYKLIHSGVKFRSINKKKYKKWHLLSELYADLRSQRGKIEDSRLTVSNYERKKDRRTLGEIPEEMDRILKLCEDARLKNISNNETAEIVLHSDWLNIEKNLKDLINKKKS